MNDYRTELLNQDRLKTLHSEADQYRLLQQTRPQKTRGFSRFQIFQQLAAFWRSRKLQARDSRGGENV
jgi:DNA polymerase III delta subunit